MAVHYYNWERKTTFDQGYVVPVACKEVFPGEDIRHKMDALIRTQPLNAPVYHKLQVKVVHAYIPVRLVWPEFEDFIVDPDTSIVHPFIDMTGGGTIGDLADHLSLTPDYEGNVSALPFRAYDLFYNEFVRDQEVQSEVTIDTTSGEDTTSNTSLKRACWQKDYFTPQDGCSHPYTTT